MKTHRRRYVKFELIMEGNPITDQQFVSAVRRSLINLYGEVAVADSRLFLQNYDEETGKGVLQVEDYLLEHTLAAASLIHTIESTRVSFIPQKTSGTLRALSRKTTN